MALPYWRADIKRYPLIVVHLVGADGVQQPDVESLIRIVDDMIEKRERVVVYDLTDSMPDAQRRQLLVTSRWRSLATALPRWAGRSIKGSAPACSD